MDCYVDVTKVVYNTRTPFIWAAWNQRVTVN